LESQNGIGGVEIKALSSEAMNIQTFISAFVHCALLSTYAHACNTYTTSFDTMPIVEARSAASKESSTYV
jgi:hypothetical protein